MSKDPKEVELLAREFRKLYWGPDSGEIVDDDRKVARWVLNRPPSSVTSGDGKCQCKVPAVDHNDVSRIHGSKCVTCGGTILFPSLKPIENIPDICCCATEPNKCTAEKHYRRPSASPEGVSPSNEEMAQLLMELHQANNVMEKLAPIGKKFLESFRRPSASPEGVVTPQEYQSFMWDEFRIKVEDVVAKIVCARFANKGLVQLDEKEVTHELANIYYGDYTEGCADHVRRLAKAICSKFGVTSNKAEIKWPEKIPCEGNPEWMLPFGDRKWNEAIDACKKAWSEAYHRGG